MSARRLLFAVAALAGAAVIANAATVRAGDGPPAGRLACAENLRYGFSGLEGVLDVDVKGILSGVLGALHGGPVTPCGGVLQEQENEAGSAEQGVGTPAMESLTADACLTCLPPGLQSSECDSVVQTVQTSSGSGGGGQGGSWSLSQSASTTIVCVSTTNSSSTTNAVSITSSSSTSHSSP